MGVFAVPSSEKNQDDGGSSSCKGWGEKHNTINREIQGEENRVPQGVNLKRGKEGNF